MKGFVAAVVIFAVVFTTGVSYSQGNGSDEVPAKVQKFFERGIGTWIHEWKEGDAVIKQTFISEWGPGKKFLVNTNKVNTQGKEDAWFSLMCWDGKSPDGIIGYGIGPGGNIHENGRARVISETEVKGTDKGTSDSKDYTEQWELRFDSPDTVSYTFTRTTEGKTSPVMKAMFNRVKATSDEQELIRLQDEWCRAEMDGDAAALGRILADEYMLVISNGTVLSRAQLLREVETREVPFTTIAVEDTRVKLYGNMAVVKGVVKWSDAGGTKNQSLFTETWQRRDGRWQCLATHESGEQEIVTPEKTPGYEKMKRLLGYWTYEGNVDSQWKDTPFGPTGKFKGEFQARFVLNGNFVEEHWQDVYEDGSALGGTTIYRYDADTGNIMSNGFLSDGTRDNIVYTIDGDTMTGDLKQTGSDGTESLVKAVWKYGQNYDSFTATWNLSLDDGKTWKRWLSYEAKKVKK